MGPCSGTFLPSKLSQVFRRSCLKSSVEVVSSLPSKLSQVDGRLDKVDGRLDKVILSDISDENRLPHEFLSLLIPD